LEKKEEKRNFKDRIASVLPVIQWLPKYKRNLLRFDIIAGLTLAAFAIPDAMAFASLAGLPPEIGLYATIVAPLAYFLFGTSRQTSVGPSSSESILIATVLGVIALGDPARYLSLAALAALMVGVIAIVAWVLRLGFLVNLIGTGIVIIVSQLPKLLGITGAPSGFLAKIFYMLQNLGGANLYVVAIGIVGIILVLALERKFPKVPCTLILIILAISLMSVTNLVERGVHIVGEIPQGLPSFAIPECTAQDVSTLLPLALALFILSYVELSTNARIYARKRRYHIDTDQELLALGASSIATGLFQGYPIAGSFSKSAVSDRSGAKTQLAGAVAALAAAIVVMFFTGFFYNLPETILAALIIVAVIKMVDFKGLFRIGQISKRELSIAVTTLCGVLVFGILPGVLIGVLLSFIDLGYRITRPHTAVQGRIPGTEIYGDFERRPEKEDIPGVLIIRVDAPLVFGNTEMVKEIITDLIKQQKEPVHLVVLDLGASPIIDVTAADMIGELYSDLREQEIELKLAEASGQVRDVLRKAGIEARIGKLGRSTTIHAVIEEWQSSKSG
jgi:high affinity sulfate transporter 1